MPLVEGVQVNAAIIEGKTKVVYPLDKSGECLVVSKDCITAGDGAKAHELVGKAEISNKTIDKVYTFLQAVGLNTHYIRSNSPKSFIARHCYMIPIEFVTRRIATGSFLKRHPGVPEGYRFSPPKVEYFFKDDANHDPQWSLEQLISARLTPGGEGGRVVTADDIDILTRTTRTVFEVLERAWASQDCQLVDMKIEFGLDVITGELLLADAIDSDSWRLWPGGDKRMMKDKQVYRDMEEVTAASLDTVKRNFAWVADRLSAFIPALDENRSPLVVVIAGSSSDAEFCKKITSACSDLGLNSVTRYTSAHKSTDEALTILAQYEGLIRPCVIIAVAGRSNGLGPVMSANSAIPVINCPPLGDTSPYGPLDIWSSLRLPSGLGCPTVMSPQSAALAAAHAFALNDHVTWSRIRCQQLNTWIGLKRSDAKVRGF